MRYFSACLGGRGCTQAFFYGPEKLGIAREMTLQRCTIGTRFFEELHSWQNDSQALLLGQENLETPWATILERLSVNTVSV